MNSYFKKLVSDPTRPLALLFSLVMALAFSVRCCQTPHFLYALLAFRYWVMSGFLSNRFPADRPVKFHERVLANASKFIPYLYHAPLPSASRILHTIADPLAVAGTLLSTWALINLGRRFGVSPAKRGEICRTGAYRWFRHPIYVGYALVEAGCALLNHSNFPTFILSMGTLIVRARMEDRVLKN